MTSRRPSVGATVMLAALLLGTAALCTELYESQRNTLANNGRWSVSKMSLERSPPSAKEYYESRPALSANHLDLSPYHGYQEVLFRPSSHLRELAGRFWLDESAYLAVIFDRDERGFSGVLISRDPSFEPKYFEASPDGEFLRRAPLAAAGAGWHRFRLLLDGAQARLFVDGTLWVTEPRRAGAGQFGFRGGARHSYVDDLEIDTDDGHFSESFRNTSGYRSVFACALAGLLTLIGLTLLGARRRPRPIAQVTLGICLFIGLFAIPFGLVDHYFLSARFRLNQRDQEKWNAFVERQIESLRTMIKRTYAAERGHLRVVVIGASQAAGTGARDESDRWTARLERRFARELPQGRVECINLAVFGSALPDLVEPYRVEGLALEPQLLVVYPNLELDQEGLRQGLESLAELNQRRGIRTLFVLEAHANPTGFSKAQVEIMRSVGARYGIEVVDLQNYFTEHGNDGFRFWDRTHFASFGQQLTADRLYPAISKALEPGAVSH